MNVLVASLGESPAVVTATLDALEREDRVRIERVVTIGTGGWDVGRSVEVLHREFQGHYGGRVAYIPDQVEAQDLLAEADHLAYLQAIARWLKTYRAHRVYLSLSGGRKTMSALVAIAAQLYGAHALCHVVPQDPTLEESSKVDQLLRLPVAEQARVLHPGQDEVHLVRLPLLSLFPLLDDILATLRGGQGTDPRAADVLLASGLVAREGGAMVATPPGRQLLELLDEVEQLPAPRAEAGACEVAIQDHGYGGKRERVKLYAEKLASACPWATKVETIPYGPRPRTAIRARHPDGRIELDVRVGELAIGLCVHTTARTAGQTERVARELEKLLAGLR
ncbi:MAG: hypothetical protein HY690_18765 [Chloroflexi bacterium]|nr:hypothetical protein [Chloroflexota bacterium]